MYHNASFDLIKALPLYKACHASALTPCGSSTVSMALCSPWSFHAVHPWGQPGPAGDSAMGAVMPQASSQHTRVL